MALPDYPVRSVVPELRQALADAGAAVLVAEPGAGKTTIVPLELRDEPWLGGRSIIMLEPRRLAARYAARRMASLLGENVGDTVGYRVRFDTVVSSRTRIEVVTEGVLTRLLQDDPGLERAGLVIFDEFHERSLAGDTGLALALQSKRILRPDLRLLVMSATMDAGAVARLLGDVPAIQASGRQFSVDTRYRPPRPDARLEASVASVVREAVTEETGDVLVFLPGAGEINRVRDLLAESGLDADLLPLHGSLPRDAQDAVMFPGRRRRVVLSTAIAETSLTIEGIRVVVDSGRMRVPRFSPRTGMTRLETVRVSKASADQRRGRAGRMEPGVCYRLWSPFEEAGFVPFNAPEILTTDLAPLALELAAAGVADPADLSWLDLPPPAGWRQAVELLVLMGALDTQGRITAHGRALAGLPLHPRLGELALGARAIDLTGLAALLVTLLTERDIARHGGDQARQREDADLRLRAEMLRTGAMVPGLSVDAGALKRARATLSEWRKRLRAGDVRAEDVEHCGRLLALAYPDRVAQVRSGQPGRFLLRNGRGATLPPNQPLARERFIVIADLDDRGAEARIALAAPIDFGELEAVCGAGFEHEQSIVWNSERREVEARDRIRLGALVLDEQQLRNPDPTQVREVLRDALVGYGADALPWTEPASRARSRLAFVHRMDPTRWPDVSNDSLTRDLDDWLMPHVGSVRSMDTLADIDLASLLLNRLSWKDRSELDRLAPERYETPAGTRIAINYDDPAAPVLAVKLQEMFGLADTPSVADGRVTLTLHLLSPAGRPVQITRDLRGFWRTSYFDVRKDLRGRYPKHDWPDDPMTARPTRGARRRR